MTITLTEIPTDTNDLDSVGSTDDDSQQGVSGYGSQQGRSGSGVGGKGKHVLVMKPSACISFPYNPSYPQSPTSRLAASND